MRRRRETGTGCDAASLSQPPPSGECSWVGARAIKDAHLVEMVFEMPPADLLEEARRAWRMPPMGAVGP